MGDADRGLELHRVEGIGFCRYCRGHPLATFDAAPTVGSIVICGSCAGVHTIERGDTPDGPVPVLVKPSAADRLEIHRRPEVRAVRDAYYLDQMEGRMRRASQKPPKAHNVTGRKAKVRSGDQVRLELRGPDAWSLERIHYLDYQAGKLLRRRDRMIAEEVRSGKTSASSIAVRLGLSRQRIYQIVWETEGPTRPASSPPGQRRPGRRSGSPAPR